MSYNSGYNQYSPYFQQTPGQTSQDSTGSGQQYQSHGFSTFSHHQYQQHQPYSSAVTSADRQTPSNSIQRYPEPSGAAQYQDSRGSYGYSSNELGTSRPAVDTTALGSLAYASSLGQNSRNNSSLQQIIDYNRQQARESYSHSPTYNTGVSTSTSGPYDHQQSDSRGPIGRKDDLAQRNQIQDHSRYNSGHHVSTPTYKNLSQVPKAPQATQLPQIQTREPSNENGKNSQQEYYSQQPPRPASGQNQRQQPPNQSPTALSSYRTTAPTNQLATQKSNHTKGPAIPATSKSDQDKSKQKPYTSQEAIRQPSAIEQSPRQSAPNNASTTTESQSHDRQYSSGHHGLPPLNPNDTSQQSLIHNESPMTVNPNQVFNQVEYQRRQAAAAKEKEEAAKAAKAIVAPARLSDGQQVESAGKEQQMAEEMRLMIEKMREYKAKDPSLFTSIWEQVKKGQPPASTPSSVLKDVTAAGQGQQSSTINPTQILSPGPTVGQAPSAQQGLLDDAGRSPTPKARRGGNRPGSGRKRKSATDNISENPAHNNNKPDSSLSTDPVVVTASNLMQDAMQSFHKMNTSQVNGASKSPQLIYVSGVGPPSDEQASGQSEASGQRSEIQSAHTERSTQISSHGESSKANGTAWPEHKKWDLAVAAKDILLSVPINANRNISPEDILGFLNQNPSYEQLCRLIEGKGFIIDRGHFARSILEAVPDLGAGLKNRTSSANRPAHNPITQTQISNGAPRFVNSSQDGHSANGHQAPGDNHRFENGPQKPPIAQMTPAQALKPSSPRNTESIADQKSSEEKPAVALTKQEMARKRTIAEIVDLSQLSDDDMPPSLEAQRQEESAKAQSSVQQPPPPPPPLPLACPGPPAGIPLSQFAHTPPVQNGYPSQFQRPGPYQSPYNPYSFYPPQPRVFQPPPPSPPPPPPPLTQAQRLPAMSSQQRGLLLSEDVVRPLDKSKIRRRTKYNPKYIARDVLIATGRHPTMQPLNYHLEILRKNFRQVTDLSDLGTFRWDLVDPGGDPVGLGSLPRRETDASSVALSDGLKAASGDQEKESTAAGSNGEVSTEAPSKASGPPKLLGPQRFRVSKSQTKRKQPADTPLLPAVDKSWMNAGFGNTIPARADPTQKISSTDVTTTPQPAKPAQTPASANSGSESKRRGRPPGAKNKFPRKSLTKPSAATPSQQPRKAEITSTSIPTPSQGNTISTPRTRIASTSAGPSNLKIASTPASSNIAVIIPSPTRSTASATTSLTVSSSKRPRSKTNSDLSNQYQCLWKGSCRSDFLDLELLRTHMLTHRRSTKPFPCRWKGCGNKDTRDEYEEFVPQVFGTEAEWKEHMLQKHWQPLAKMNEGREKGDEDTENQAVKRTKGEVIEIEDDEMVDVL